MIRSNRQSTDPLFFCSRLQVQTWSLFSFLRNILQEMTGKGEPQIVFATALFCLYLTAPNPIFAQPDEGKGTWRPPDLVELVRLDSTIRLDIRYATTNNFMKRCMYSQAAAFLQRPAAEALVRANEKLSEKGYGILVFDGYRPWSVTLDFWKKTPRSKRKFVANPRTGSRHNRGCAVDC